MPRGIRLLAGVALLLVLGATGLAIYGGKVKPVRHNVEQVLPNDRIPQ
jgi:hypothetical protein